MTTAKSNRRDFLKSSTAAGIATGVLTIVSPGRVRSAEANSRVRVACIGQGGRGTMITGMVQEHPGLEVAAVVDYFPNVAAAAARKFGLSEDKAFSGLMGYQRAIDSSVDAVVLKTPPYFFPEHATAAVEAGCHVYVAKPVAVDVPGCLTIRELGKKSTENRKVFHVDCGDGTFTAPPSIGYCCAICSASRCHAVVMILIGLVLLMPGCRRESIGSDKEEGPKSRLIFRFATEVKPENKVWEATRLIREELAKASPEHGIAAGEIEVEFYDQGMLGSDRKVLETCYFGVVEMVLCTSSVVTTIDPAFSLLDMPYLFIDEAHHKAVLDGPVGKELLEGLRQERFQGLAFYSCGFRNMFYKREPALPPIRRPQDLHGMKIRVMESPVMVASINALGASATPMPSSELFQALKTGVVDGAENNPLVFMADKYYEAGCNYFTWTEHFANQHVLIVNAPWFDRLESRYRRRLCQVARYIIPEYDQLWAQAVEEAVKQMQTYGVAVSCLADKQSFVRQVGDIHANFLRKNPTVPMDLYNRIKRIAE